MPLGEIGAVLLVLVVIFIVGNLWFHLVESLLGCIKRILMGHQEPPAWHTLPTEEKNDRKDERQGFD